MTIHLLIDRARISEQLLGGQRETRHKTRYNVLHPSNDAILAICDTRREAERVVEALHGLANTLAYGQRR